MFDEEWPDEPEESRPEDRWGDPERDLVKVPKAPKPRFDESEVDPELSAFWWRTVVLANIALGGVTIGPMVIFFEGMWTVGGVAFVVGALAFVRVYQHARWFGSRNDGDDHADGDETDEEDERAAADAPEHANDGDATATDDGTASERTTDDGTASERTGDRGRNA